MKYNDHNHVPFYGGGMVMTKTRDLRQGTLGQKERFKDNRHDTYREKKGLSEPTVCPDCSAVYIDKHWTWNPVPAVTHTGMCPACRRIADRCPAGTVHIEGSFLTAHRSEIMNLIRNTETAEKADRPLERIMAVDEASPARMTITTTGIHLPRRIGTALEDAFGGTLDVQYGEDEYSARVHWERS
jgi:hypothetical protein